MKLIYFEKSFIVVFGFIITSFLQFCKEQRAEKITHTEIFLLYLKALKYKAFYKKKKNESCNTEGIITFVLIWIITQFLIRVALGCKSCILCVGLHKS